MIDYYLSLCGEEKEWLRLTVFSEVKRDQIVTFGISGNANFKYWNHSGFLVIDFNAACSHTRYTSCKAGTELVFYNCFC